MVKVSISDKCIGCGACVALAPDIFEMDASTMKSKVKKQPAGPDEVDTAKQAAEACPVEAIKVE